jgi:molybdopterin-guanine dinucleotide biosynthesis protein A
MSLSAVLLAGGRSRRMGRDKAFLEIGGEPLWRRQVAKLEQVADEVLVSVHDSSSRIDSGHAKVFDPPGARGPLAGLASALRTAKHSHLLTLAVDLPAMTPGYLHSLRERLTATAGVVPMAGEFFQGTAAIYPRGILPLVEEVLASEDLSFQNLLRKAVAKSLMAIVDVTEEELSLFANWNTPDFLEEKA